ncbi:ankyrin repeat domain-containing protein [uncultured Pseudoalteromonas sp.]
MPTALKNQYEFVELLLEHVANPNTVDYFNATALHTALYALTFMSNS